jgi:hypothetical protein
MSIFLNHLATAARPPPGPLKNMVNDKTLCWRRDIPQLGVEFISCCHYWRMVRLFSEKRLYTPIARER